MDLLQVGLQNENGEIGSALFRLGVLVLIGLIGAALLGIGYLIDTFGVTTETATGTVKDTNTEVIPVLYSFLIRHFLFLEIPSFHKLTRVEVSESKKNSYRIGDIVNISYRRGRITSRIYFRQISRAT